MPDDASDDDIRKQYRKLAVLIHPDKVQYCDSLLQALVVQSVDNTVIHRIRLNALDTEEVIRPSLVWITLSGE